MDEKSKTSDAYSKDIVLPPTPKDIVFQKPTKMNALPQGMKDSFVKGESLNKDIAQKNPRISLLEAKTALLNKSLGQTNNKKLQ